MALLLEEAFSNQAIKIEPSGLSFTSTSDPKKRVFQITSSDNKMIASLEVSLDDSDKMDPEQDVTLKFANSNSSGRSYDLNLLDNAAYLYTKMADM